MGKDRQEIRVFLKATPFAGLSDDAFARLLKILETHQVETDRVLF
jgi:hypothetical protein